MPTHSSVNLSAHLDLPRLFGQLGIPVNHTVLPARGLCPVCRLDNRSGRWTLYRDRLLDGWWSHCTTCGFAGDMIQLCAALWKLRPLKATLQLIDQGLLACPNVMPQVSGYVERFIDERVRVQQFWANCLSHDTWFQHHGPREIAAAVGVRTDRGPAGWSIGLGRYLGFATKFDVHFRLVPRGLSQGIEEIPDEWLMLVPGYDLPGRISSMACLDVHQSVKILTVRGVGREGTCWGLLDAAVSCRKVLDGMPDVGTRAMIESSGLMVESILKLEAHLLDHQDPLPLVIQYSTTPDVATARDLGISVARGSSRTQDPPASRLKVLTDPEHDHSGEFRSVQVSRYLVAVGAGKTYVNDKLLFDAEIQLDMVWHIGARKYLQGKILYRKFEIPFIESVVELERRLIKWLLSRTKPYGNLEVSDFSSRSLLLDALERIYRPKSGRMPDRFGWDRDTNSILLPRFAIEVGGSTVPTGLGDLMPVDRHAPAANLYDRPPSATDMRAVAQDPEALSVVSYVVANLLAGPHGRPTRGLLAYSRRALDIAVAAGCWLCEESHDVLLDGDPTGWPVCLDGQRPDGKRLSRYWAYLNSCPVHNRVMTAGPREAAAARLSDDWWVMTENHKPTLTNLEVVGRVVVELLRRSARLNWGLPERQSIMQRVAGLFELSPDPMPVIDTREGPAVTSGCFRYLMALEIARDMEIGKSPDRLVKFVTEGVWVPIEILERSLNMKHRGPANPRHRANGKPPKTVCLPWPKESRLESHLMAEGVMVYGPRVHRGSKLGRDQDAIRTGEQLGWVMTKSWWRETILEAEILTRGEKDGESAEEEPVTACPGSSRTRP